MALLTPILLSALGDDLDAALDADGLLAEDDTPLHAGMSPLLLVACGVVSEDTATLRLYRHDEELGRWVPSAVAADVVDPEEDAGVFELRYNTAGIPGRYALVQEDGDGEVEYVFRSGRN
jgi:hypothetical protein